MKLLVAAIAIAVSGVTLLARPDPTAEGVFQTDTIVLPPTELVDQNALPHRLTEMDGLVVMTFGYTTCESICPVGNAVMAQVDAALGPRPNPPVRLISLTIDPTTDTPALMRQAARSFEASGNWLWLTAEPEGMEKVLEAVGASVDDIALHDPLFLVGDPAQGRFHRSSSLPEANELLALLNRLR